MNKSLIYILKMALIWITVSGSAFDTGLCVDLADSPSGFKRINSQLHFWGKIRYEHIAASQEHIAGSYGQPLENGDEFYYRLFAQAKAQATPFLQIGALGRFSNEDNHVLLDGPLYLNSKIGSLFVAYKKPWLDFRVGYYDIFFTPLTLMRFDPDDVPEQGSDSGCGCASQGGSIAGSILEDIKEPLTFEGGKIETLLGDHFESHFIYARSQKAVEGDRFRRNTWGARLLFRQYLTQTHKDLIISLQSIYHADEACSIDAIPGYNPVKNQVGSLYGFYPAFYRLHFFGEWAYSTSKESQMCQKVYARDNFYGVAATSGIDIFLPHQITTQLAYLYQSRDFTSLFKALTYLPNRQGGRLRFSWTIDNDQFTLTGFLKYLEEIKSDELDHTFFQGILIDIAPAQFLTASLGLTFQSIKSLTFKLAWQIDQHKRESNLNFYDIDTQLDTYLAGVNYTFFRDNVIEIKYQFLDYKDKINSPLIYDAHIATAQIRLQY